MKNTLLLLALVLLPYGPAAAATDYYLKIDGVDGETTAAPERADPPRAAVPTLEATVTTPPQEASADAFIKFDGVDGETKGGDVEFEWKVEEGESAPPSAGGSEVAADAQPLTPDFSILLGGSGGDDEEASESGRAQASEILLQGMQEAGVPAEQVSMNFEKIETRVRQEIKLLGLIPVSVLTTVEIDADERVAVKYPWWSFLAGGKDASLGEKVFSSISNVLKSKHDALKSAIGVIR